MNQKKGRKEGRNKGKKEEKVKKECIIIVDGGRERKEEQSEA